jgi:hypothetical protein
MRRDRGNTATFIYIHSFGANLINEARANFTRFF